MACSSWDTTFKVEKGRLQSGAGQRMPSGVTLAMERAMPSKREACLQKRHLRDSRAQSLKRMESGIWLSSGLISCVWFEDATEAMLYFLVSRPRHSARRTASVPGIGAQRRSMGGKICL